MQQPFGNHHELASGMLVGEYLLEARIGRGATGEVWSAHHHVWTERRAAVKIPTNPEFLRTIKHEGIVHDDLSELESPHLVKVFGLSIAADPPYMVMQLVDGQDLRDRLNQAGKLSVPETLRILEGTLKGLSVAHERGIVHRDIKPENILLDKQGTALLTDFSIATRAPSVESLRLSIETDPGSAPSLAGTLVYMSPEQRQGGRVDQRSDIYSLGLLLFEMLTGEIPQPGDRLREFLPTLPEAVEALFLRCFQRADRRFADAASMLVAMQSLHQPGAVERISGKAHQDVAKFSPSAARPKARKSRTTARLSTRDPQPNPASSESSRRKPVLSTRSMESLRPSGRPAEKPSEPARVAKKETRQETRQRLTSRPAGVEDVNRLLTELPDDGPPEAPYSGLQDPRPSRAYDEVLPSLNTLYKQAASASAVSLYASGKFRKAVEEFREVLKKNPNDLQAKKGLALGLMRLDQPKQALATYQEVLSQNPELAEVWNNVGVISMSLNKLKDAEQALLRAVELRPRYASAHSNLGAVYSRLKRPEDSKRHSEMALEIDPDNLAAGYNSIL